MLLQYNLTNRKTPQSYKLNYFIKQWVMFLIKVLCEQTRELTHDSLDYV